MTIRNAPLSRRRFLVTAAMTALLPAAPLRPASLNAASLNADTAPMLRWTGRALGGAAEIRLYHDDPAAAREALAEAALELERLEKALSLFRPDSALVRLNREGGLANPPLDLVRAIAEANAMAAATDGAFDITIQPLWDLYAETLSRTGRPPEAADLAQRRRLIGWRRIEMGTDAIRLPRPGMALTLNGMGQGYITDRVAELLRRRGFPHVLVDLGEFRAPAARPDGSPWPVAIRDPACVTRAVGNLGLAEAGLATSEAHGSSFRPGAHDGHIIDPASGRPVLEVASVTVQAATATRADLLSTAIAAAGLDKAARILKAGGGRSALLVDGQGRIHTISA